MALCFVALSLIACESTPSITEPNSGAGQVSIEFRLGKLAAASIARAEIVITAPDMDDLRQDLTIDGNLITGDVRSIPAGSNRLFTLNGYDASETLIYTGSSSAEVISGEEVIVRIVVQRLSQASDTTPDDVDETAPIQWSGNEHYYELVLVSQYHTWDEARVSAESRTYMGLPGHLVTIHSAAENAFVLELVSGTSDEIPTVWIGGFQPEGSSEPGGNWQWVTGEEWAYTNWDPPNPNDAGGNEDHLQMLTGFPYRVGTWADISNDNPDLRPFVVEYGSSGDARIESPSLIFNGTGNGTTGVIALSQGAHTIQIDKNEDTSVTVHLLDANTGEEVFINFSYLMSSEGYGQTSISKSFVLTAAGDYIINIEGSLGLEDWEVAIEPNQDTQNVDASGLTFTGRGNGTTGIIALSQGAHTIQIDKNEDTSVTVHLLDANTGEEVFINFSYLMSSEGYGQTSISKSFVLTAAGDYIINIEGSLGLEDWSMTIR